MDYKDILINILSLSYFYNKNTNTQYLLLEPIVMRKIHNNLDISKEELIKYISNFFNSNTSISEQIMTYYISSKIIQYNKQKNIYVINTNYKNDLLSQYEQVYLENSNKINSIESFFINNIKNIKYNNILEDIYNFFVRYLNIYDDYHNDNNPSDVEQIIAIILNEMKDQDNEYYLDIIKSIIKGLIILKAVLNNNKSNLLKNKKPRIYLDNIFVTNLFTWCEPSYYESSILILETLRNLKFDIFIHSITLELILDYVHSARQINVNMIKRNSLFYNILYIDYNNKNAVDISNCPIHSIKNVIIEALSKYGIKILSDINYKSKEENKKLYDKIHNDRKLINMKRKKRDDLREKQTLYDYTIILYYNKVDLSEINRLYNMQNIFLTFQNAILNNVLYKTKDLYTPIMNVNNFMNLLLLETVILNIEDYSNLINIAIINSYSNILNHSFNVFVNNVYNDMRIKNKDQLLDLVLDPEGRRLIIENKLNPIKTQRELINKIKTLEEELKNKDEELKNKLKNKDEELENKLKNKDEELENKLKIKDSETDLKIKNYKKDKFIFKLVLIILLSILLFIISDAYIAKYIVVIINKVKKDFINTNYVSIFISMLPTIIGFIRWLFRKK
ncbi:hypothetical protein [Brachyspira pilosicoli]|uniref:hypothetical protein n=1 Tax=Brachyspira pilosicoli TaxID=52584 RepID=UPI002543EF75|nr:hypothetical protein [Brachyspira pilosicoli]WIH87828.1 hypothetical protein NEI05_10085 [Brachyspira pilosicoli]